jgi:hypothetical protein
MAVNAHGYVRATRDVDVMVTTPLRQAQEKLDAAGVRTTLFRGDVLEGDFPCLKGVLGGIPFDVLPALVALDPERLVILDLHGQPLPVVDFETLVRLKLRAGGPKDHLDVAVLVNVHPERRARVLELAGRDAPRIAAVIDDPRVKRDVAERREEDRLLRASRLPAPAGEEAPKGLVHREAPGPDRVRLTGRRRPPRGGCASRRR